MRLARKLRKALPCALLACCLASGAQAASVFVEEDGTSEAFRTNDAARAAGARAIVHRIRRAGIPAGDAYVPKGTCLDVVLAEDVVGRRLRAGDSVAFRLKEDFVVNSVVMAPRNTQVLAYVTESSPAWGYGHGGKLALQTEGFRLRNGALVPLELYLREEGRGMHDGGLALLSGFLPSALIAGRDARMPEGAAFIAYVPEDTGLGISVSELDEHLPPGHYENPAALAPTPRLAVVPCIDGGKGKRSDVARALQGGYDLCLRERFPVEVLPDLETEDGLARAGYHVGRRDLPGKEAMANLAVDIGADYVVAMELSGIRYAGETRKRQATASYQLYIAARDELLSFETEGYGDERASNANSYYFVGQRLWQTPTEAAVADALCQGNEILARAIEDSQWER